MVFLQWDNEHTAKTRVRAAGAQRSCVESSAQVVPLLEEVVFTCKFSMLFYEFSTVFLQYIVSCLPIPFNSKLSIFRERP